MKKPHNDAMFVLHYILSNITRTQLGKVLELTGVIQTFA